MGEKWWQMYSQKEWRVSLVKHSKEKGERVLFHYNYDNVKCSALVTWHFHRILMKVWTIYRWAEIKWKCYGMVTMSSTSLS